MMNSSDSCWVWFCEGPAVETLSICVASWPVRWIWRPLGALTWPNSARIPSTTPLASGPPLNETTSAWTSA